MTEHRRAVYDAPVRAELARRTPGVAEPYLSNRSVRLVLVEDGTSGLDDPAPPDGGDQTLLIAQAGGERPGEFAQRAIRRISALGQQQQSIVRTILLLAPRFDAEATAARVCLARALRASSAAMTAGPSELLLSAGGDLTLVLQAKVLALVDALTGEPSGSSLPIRVQFAPDTISRTP
ncbi:MAG: hypothetical protein ABI895_34155 [Deltaproteobacteria bacterium]